jgi:glycerophosphoryl diester phosphodiesterase
LCIEGVIFHMLVLGHRGASAFFPENTLAALAAALDQGADGVELDVRRTADGALALSHDPHLPDGRAVIDVVRSELPDSMAVLGEALDVLTEARIVNIEIKNLPGDPDFDESEQVAADVVALLRGRAELAGGRMLVSSFHLATIDRVHELAPELSTAWLVIDPAASGETIERTARRGHVALHPHHAFVNADIVAAAHAAGLAVNTWTCDEPERIRWLADLGVDAVVTNDPPAALAALGR